MIVYENSENLKNIWAPELHIIDGSCYIYVAADDGNNENHRMYILSNDSDNPLKPYKNCGIVLGTEEKWAIDGTIFKYHNELYFVWSGCTGDIHYKQEIFIAKMESPFKLASRKVLISTPEYDWEMRGGDGINLAFINEGPAPLEIDGTIYIVYSASGCWCKDYCLGLLKMVGGDPLNLSSWEKSPYPIFSNRQNVIGPGHCSFVKDETMLYMFFHSFTDPKDYTLENVTAKYIELDLKKKNLMDNN